MLCLCKGPSGTKCQVLKNSLPSRVLPGLVFTPLTLLPIAQVLGLSIYLVFPSTKSQDCFAPLGQNADYKARNEVQDGCGQSTIN